MVWLSMVVMVPFDLSIVDSAALTDGQPLVGSMLSLATSFLASTGPPREAAAVLAARLLTRPGLHLHLRAFVSWGVDQIILSLDEGGVEAEREGRPTSLTAVDGQGDGHLTAGEGEGGIRSVESSGGGCGSAFTIVGIFSALAAAFKLGHRGELGVLIPLLTPLTARAKRLCNDPSAIRRKLWMKLLQRASSVLLPPRIASWRYSRGCRVLLESTPGGEEGRGGGKGWEQRGGEEGEEVPEEGEEVPEEIEEILDQLLCGLRDADTIVRWSAAKGIGRVTGRLPLELADDVVGSVLELLSPSEESNAWHGGCLALAELARRGLLLPSRLGEVREG